MKRLAILLWFILPALVWGQIELPTSSPSNTVIKARCITQKPADGRIRYRWSAPTLSLVESETGKLAYLTGVSGTHTVTVTVATATADTLELEDFSAVITFEGDAPVPPKPVPTPVTLRSLVDDEQAAKLASFYRDFAAAVGTTPPATVKQFLTVHDTMFALLNIDNPQLDSALAKRLGTMELDGLSDSLLKLAGEFGDGPVVDPVTPEPDSPGTPVSFDGFRVLFTEESEDRSAWFYDLTADPRIADYLNTHCEGGRSGWRVWDADEDGENAAPEMRELARLEGSSQNTLVIASRKRAIVVPLKEETSVMELLELFRQHGG